TRSVLEAMTRVPGLRIGITTKGSGITRDLDLLGVLARQADLWVNVSLISLDAALLRLIAPRAPRPDRPPRPMHTLAAAARRTRLCVRPVLPLTSDGEAAPRALLQAARSAGAREAISQALFLRTAMAGDFFLEFVEREFPWALPGYRELFPRPGSAPRDVRLGIERLVDRLARESGFSASSREERVRDEAPPRPRQLSLIW